MLQVVHSPVVEKLPVVNKSLPPKFSTTRSVVCISLLLFLVAKKLSKNPGNNPEWSESVSDIDFPTLGRYK